MERTVEEIARKMDALGLWGAIAPYNWALKPAGTVFPYFCTTMLGDCKPVKVRFLLLEGWQTLHDYVHVRVDRNFGFYSSPIELPHFELVVLENGDCKLFRHDTGYMPTEVAGKGRLLAARLLWEAYGVMLRLETDPKLPMRFADEKAVFARVEVGPGAWEDRPLEIPTPPPHIEKISFEKAEIKRAQDRPFAPTEVLHVGFGLVPGLMTKEPRPRCVYRLVVYDPASKTLVADKRVSLTPEGGLRHMWETMPSEFLRVLVESGRIPGEVKVASGRVFRMLRPLCMELPFKLSLHDNLELP